MAAPAFWRPPALWTPPARPSRPWWRLAKLQRGSDGKMRRGTDGKLRTHSNADPRPCCCGTPCVFCPGSMPTAFSVTVADLVYCCMNAVVGLQPARITGGATGTRTITQKASSACQFEGTFEDVITFQVWDETAGACDAGTLVAEGIADLYIHLAFGWDSSTTATLCVQARRLGTVGSARTGHGYFFEGLATIPPCGETLSFTNLRTMCSSEFTGASCPPNPGTVFRSGNFARSGTAEAVPL